MENETSNRFLFKPVQFFGNPPLFPPMSDGKIPAAAQFVIPGLRIGQDKDNFIKLGRSCGDEVWDVSLAAGRNDRTGEEATLVTFAFYIPHTEGEHKIKQSTEATGRLLVERYLGLLSFFGGIKCSFTALQFTIGNTEGQFRHILPMTRRTSIPKVHFAPPKAPEKQISDNLFSALFWLRRGLAERDPIETFSSLMVCIQILARELVSVEPTLLKCESCGSSTLQEPSITSLVRELIVTTLKAEPSLFSRLWKARNSIVAHGNKSVTAKVLLELTELKFDAADLAFRGINLALGIPVELGPTPNQSFFVTDAFMYVD